MHLSLCKYIKSLLLKVVHWCHKQISCLPFYVRTCKIEEFLYPCSILAVAPDMYKFARGTTEL